MSFWEDIEYLKKLLREQRWLLERFLAGEMGMGLFPETSLRPEEPLYRIEDLGDSYRVIVDLPAANPSTLKIDVLVDRIVIEAEVDIERLSESPSWTREERTIRRYHAVIHLPEPVEPRKDLIRVSRRDGLLIIVVPKMSG
ncbi:MAG: Hsp20/alpha crystallin family protein [Desulfurococcales archaeon]|nr:Hsp20/alpha crystallin family protein [Desulfurococcales archaeon]